MLKTYLYIPENLGEEISVLAQNLETSKADVIRRALKEGITQIKKQKTGSLDVLTRIAEIAKNSRAKGPKDLSTNHDKYLWDEYGQ